MKIWQEYKLTQGEALRIGKKTCPCGIIHDHALYVEKFWIWIRFKGYGKKPFSKLKWIYKIAEKRNDTELHF